MIISIDPKSPVPPFEQLRAQLATMIATGVLRPGDKLPPVRQLAADLELAPGTVGRAIRELEQEGFLDTQGHRGTFVVDRPPERLSTSARRERLSAAAREYALIARQLGVDVSDAVESARSALKEISSS